MLEITSEHVVDSALQAPRASSLRRRSAVEHRPEVDRVHGAIFDAAMDRRLLPGARLTEASLCALFDCSRSTVRAALAELAHDKIVLLQPNRGASIWQASAQEVRDVFSLRSMLECSVLERLQTLPDLAQRLQPLHRMVEREERAFLQRDRISWLRLSNAFHVELAGLLGNPELTDLLASLCARTTLFIALADHTADSTCSFHEHRDMLQWLAQKEWDQARLAMARHLQDCVQRIQSAEARAPDPWAAFSAR